ncbi:MAG TPA: DUF222 domain-containing protein [Mycobacterium sp.]|nr:DUF222 domain-containing protein [Mycobacterium sp.]
MFDESPPPLSVAEVLDDPDQAAAWLAVQAPGPESVAGVSILEPAALSQGGRVDALVAIERQLAWLAGMQQRVLAVIAAADTADDRWTREDVACALRLSGVTASRRLAVAQTLHERLPATLALLDRGAISYLHTMTLAEATYGLDADVAVAVETRVLTRAGEQTLGEFKRSLTRAVHALDPRRAEDQHQQAMTERRVVITPREDGMAELWALLPAEGAAALICAVDALAAATANDDPRSADQRRADALIDLAVTALHDPHLPRAHGLRPTIQVTVAASTLLGCDDQPGELTGHGPIPASLARRLAADQTGTWRRLVTDPVTGKLLDYGRSTYRPPKDLAEFVIARDQHCTFPGCQRAAHRCDLDHQHPASSGGPTNTDNVAALCRRHHRAKHHAGWQPQRDIHTGDTEWTSPTGHTYQSSPPGYPTADPDPPSL